MSFIESTTRIEPLLFQEPLPPRLASLTVDLQSEAARLGHSLHPDVVMELADFVRIVNCHHSNLIEGHDTHPVDIERALAGVEVEPERRALALEAKSHVEVQREVDALHARKELPVPTSPDFVRWLHRRFYGSMPVEFRQVEKPDGTTMKIVPGEFRSSREQDVVVGRHQPPSSERVVAFMEWFAKRFAAAERQASVGIVAIATAHHRFNYVHPFVDGNGRVSRLVSHAMGLRAGIGGGGLWSVSRGLACGLRDRGEYKRMLDHADSPRQGDRDGRGNLSEAALAHFSEWFLTVALDQIRFSAVVFDLSYIEERYRSLVRDVTGDKRAPDLVSFVLRHGALSRGDAGHLLKTSERTARTTLKDLEMAGFFRSDTPESPVRIAFPMDYRERLFPGIFTDAEIIPTEVPQPRSGR